MKYLLPILIIIITLFIILFLVLFNKKPIKKIENINHFYFNYSTGYGKNDNVSYTIKCKDKCVATIKPDQVDEDEAIIVELSKEKIKELEEILNKYEVIKWNKFHKSDPNVLDGDGFSLGVDTEDKTSISASGYMMWPKNYGNVKGELDSFFKNYES